MTHAMQGIVGSLTGNAEPADDQIEDEIIRGAIDRGAD